MTPFQFHFRSPDGARIFELHPAFARGVLSVFLAVVAGCTSSTAPGPSAPKPGKGIAEYRAVAGEAHDAVQDTIKALDTLSSGAIGAANAPLKLTALDKAFRRLEVTSVRARARAEAIIARGQAYFDEWKENLAGVRDPAAAKAETERFERLFEHFARVRQRSGEIRDEFRPFMAGLREFRAALDHEPASGLSATSRTRLELVAAGGRRVLRALETVSSALDEAEIELRTMAAANPGKEMAR